MLLLAIGLLAFVGVAFVPGGAFDFAAGDHAAPDADGIAGSDTGSQQLTSAQPDSLRAWNAGAVELPRAADGHFYAQAKVNGNALGFLVDTGASTVALTGPDAEAIGLYWSPADVRIVAQGASGPVHGVDIILDHVELGGHEMRGVRAVIVPEGLNISLLGQSFLSSVDPVRIESDKMVLGG